MKYIPQTQTVTEGWNLAAYFYDFVQALISHHADVWLTVISAEQEHLHGDAQKFLKLWRCSAPGPYRRIVRKCVHVCAYLCITSNIYSWCIVNNTPLNS